MENFKPPLQKKIKKYFANGKRICIFATPFWRKLKIGEGRGVEVVEFRG